MEIKKFNDFEINESKQFKDNKETGLSNDNISIVIDLDPIRTTVGEIKKSIYQTLKTHYLDGNKLKKDLPSKFSNLVMKSDDAFDYANELFKKFPNYPNVSDKKDMEWIYELDMKYLKKIKYI